MSESVQLAPKCGVGGPQGEEPQVAAVFPSLVACLQGKRGQAQTERTCVPSHMTTVISILVAAEAYSVQPRDFRWCDFRKRCYHNVEVVQSV